VIVPEVGPALSAAGALVSDLTTDFSTTHYATTQRFDAEGVNRVLDALCEKCAAFTAGPGASAASADIELAVEGRYPHQVWDLEVALPSKRFSGPGDVEQLRQAFHDVHREIFAISDDESEVEFLNWRARARCRLRTDAFGAVQHASADGRTEGRTREVTFIDAGTRSTPVVHLDELGPGQRRQGPLVIESPWTTIVVDPGAAVELASTGTVVIHPEAASEAAPLAAGRREESPA
jgi:N-methylhydantoinase A